MSFKLLVVGDLHGNMPKVYYNGFDALIAPGDFCANIREPYGKKTIRDYMFEAVRRNMENPGSKEMWYDIAGRRKARKLVRKSLEAGRKILKFLNSFGAPVYIVPGNWDWVPDKRKDAWAFMKKDHYGSLLKGLDNIVDVCNRRVDMGDYQIIGHGITSGPEYPQYKEDIKLFKPNELKKMKTKYERRKKRLSSLFEKATKPVIFLTHNVPFNTPIDKIMNKASPRYGYHFGSLIARELIDKHQPLISIGGHMHEHFRKCRLGKTTAVNAGYGSYVNVWMELTGNRIRKLEFHKGKA